MIPPAPEPTDAITLTPIGTFETGLFDESAAEIVAYDPVSQRLFSTNANDRTVDIIDIADPTSPTRIDQIDVNDVSPDGEPNSVAVSGGIVAVAVADADDTAPGIVALYDTDGGLLNTLTVGVLPDALTFTPDGTRIIVANEAEADGGVDSEASISIVDLSAGAENATVTQVDFSAFNGREDEFREKGVRIFPDKTVAEDVEPEFVAVSPDGSTAFITLQEQNAFAVLDIEAATIVDILPLGAKDHLKGNPVLTTFDLTDALPTLGTTDAGQEIALGGLSGLHYVGLSDAGNLIFATVPDRGPNADTVDVDGDGVNERPLALPDYQARVEFFELNPDTGAVAFTDSLFLSRIDGLGNPQPITGRPNKDGDEEPVDLFGDPLGLDPFGADMEGVVFDAEGNIWTVDEYRPAIYKFDADGVLIDRFVPEGTAASVGEPDDTFGTETLPEEYADRRPNRGFEAVALDEEAGVLYAFIQTPLANPDRAASDASDTIRILGIDIATGEAVAEYVYLLEAPDFRDNKVDKIGDAVYAGDGKFFVIERDSSTDPDAKKYVFEINLKGATNLLAEDAPDLPDGVTLEQLTADELIDLGIEPVNKIKTLNLPSVGYQAGDKPEGLTLLPDGRLVVLNDNDFGLLGDVDTDTGTLGLAEPTFPVVLGIIEFDGGNKLDPSNEDGGINIANFPVFGLFQPDSIASYEVDGRTYYVTANEGDGRDEVVRVADITLDPDAFPNAAELQADDVLGRLEVSGIDGDIDGDGDFDQLFAYGGRSFSIWDERGNLVFDSGDDFATITADLFPDNFNPDNDENDFDSRSDDSGPEPEAIAVGEIDGSTYAFIGLERVGGIMVYDVTDPTDATFTHYINTRDFAGDPEAGTAGDLGPESISFISADDSPTGEPLLAVAHEVSGTVTLFKAEVAPVENFKLQILHASDLEGGIDAIGLAPNFAAIEAALEAEADAQGFASITLSAGDNYLSGPFFNAAGEAAVFNPLFEGLYNSFALFDVDGDGVASPLIDVSQIAASADTDGNGFFDLSEIDAFLLDPAQNTAGLTAADIFITDVNGDGNPDFFDEIDNFAGRVDISIMNLIGFDASALGNHEFDLGTDVIENIIEFDTEQDNGLSSTGEQSILDAFPGHQNFLQEVDWPGALFPYLSSNLDFDGADDVGNLFTDELSPTTDFISDLIDARVNPADPTETAPFNPSPDKIAPATIIEEGGERIGVVGATTPLLESLSSPGTVGVLGQGDLQNLADLIQVQIDRLVNDEGINKIVLVSHLQQFSIEQELSGLLSGVDVIIAGGSDTIVADDEDVDRGLQPGDTPDVNGYPFFGTDADGKPVAIVSTDGNYQYVGRLVIEFDENGDIIPDSVDENVSGAFATTDDGVRDLFDIDDGAPLDAAFGEGTAQEAVKKLVDAVSGVVTEQDGQIFGQTDVFLDGTRAEVRTEETNLGSLTADANLAAARQFDDTVLVSIKNAGGIRDNIGFSGQSGTGEFVQTPPEANPGAGKEEGDVSQLDIANALRFNNGLSLQTLTPEQLIVVLEHAVAGTAPGATPGQFGQVGGLRFSFDPDGQAQELDGSLAVDETTFASQDDLLDALVTTPGERIESVALQLEDGSFITLVEDGELVDGAPEAIRIVTLDFLAGGGDGYPFDVFEAAFPDFADRIDLEDVLTDEGNATFAAAGSEQDALAEFLFDNFNQDTGGTPFGDGETAPEDDERIQNLNVREDTVLDVVETAIYDIQGAGHVSAFVGEEVTTSGIVTAVDSNGFYVQDPDGDGDIATSDGLFVFTGGAPSVLVGDAVRLTGTVSEFVPGDFEPGNDDGNLSITQFAFPDIEVLSSGNDLPDAVILGSGGRVVPNSQVIDPSELPTDGSTIDLRDPADAAANPFNPEDDGIDFFESLEGMRVTVEDAVAIAPTNQFGETWLLTNNGDNIAPGDARVGRDGVDLGLALSADADGFGDTNPERVQIQFDSGLLPDGFDPDGITNGDQLGDVTGVVGYSFGNFEVNVTEEFTVTPSDIEPEETELTGGDDELSVATYNVLNLSATSSDDAQRDQLASQIVNNLGSPDIIALQEIQDNNGSAVSTDDGVLSADMTLQMLVDAIAAAGGPQYEFVSAEVDAFGETGGVPGGNIRNAFLYNPDRVAAQEIVTLEVEELTALGVTDPNTFDGTRDPLLGTFLFNGQEITLINNHLTSRFGSSPIFGATHPFTQAGEEEREAETLALNEIVDALLGDDPDANIVVLGDLNTFDFITDLTDNLPGVGDEQVLTNLITDKLTEDDAYTFIFQGNSQVLDHIFVTDGLLDGAEVDIVHVNNDFPTQSPLVASDHEPVVARFSLPPAPGVIAGTDEADELIGTRDDDTILGFDGDDFINARRGDDEIDAGAGDDEVFGGSGDDTIMGGEGDDFVHGGGGTDTITASPGDDFVRGGSGNDVINTGEGNDTVLGGSGDDEIDTGSGDDEASGRAGNDTIMGGEGNDDLRGNAGDDMLFGEAGNDEVDGGDGNDDLFGGADNDELLGGNGDDLLDGGDGDDELNGGRGNDTIEGGAGDDTMTGKTGDDDFLFASGSGADTVTDFGRGSDTMTLDGFDFADAAAVLAAAEQVGRDVVITLDEDAGDSITLLGVDLDDLSEGDIVLV